MRNKKIGFAMGVAAVGAGIIGVGFTCPIVAANASVANHATTIQYEKTPFRDDVYKVVDGVASYMTFDQWASDGYPEPQLVRAIPGTRYLQQGGIDTVFALIGDRSERLSFEEWVAAGTPTPTEVSFEVFKYRAIDDLYAISRVSGDQEQWLFSYIDPRSWARMGYPQPQITTRLPFARYVQNSNNPTEIWVIQAQKAQHLSFAEWLQAGAPRPTELVDVTRPWWSD